MQWEQDLAAVHETVAVPPLQFDGRTLRLTRSARGRRALVAWALRDGAWWRWAGPVVRAAALQQSWLRQPAAAGWRSRAAEADRRRRGLAGLLLPRQRLDQRAVHRQPQRVAQRQPASNDEPRARTCPTACDWC
jgi:hypothetical protein